MSELFDDAEEKESIAEEEFVEAEVAVVVVPSKQRASDARRRLENLLEEKRLRDELEDFIDY